jgi:hypothetical protein
LRVRELTGHDEEILADRSFANGADQVTELLTRVIVAIDGLPGDINRGLVDGLLVGDRDYLLLRLRRRQPAARRLTSNSA